MPPRPTLVFATPRSGSTLAHEAIAHYLKAVHGTENLGEYFNLDRFRDPEPMAVEDSLRERFSRLESAHGRYTFKIFSMIPVPQKIVPFPESRIEYLLNEFNWVLVERRNVYEQALSYAVSWSTRIFYQPGGIHPKEGSLELSPLCLDALSQFMVRYQLIKQRVSKPWRILYYEDFSAQADPRGWLKDLDFGEAVDFQGFVPPEKQNAGDKLRYFKRPRDFLTQYRNSVLQSVYPI